MLYSLPALTSLPYPLDFPHIEATPRPSNSQGNKQILFQLTDDKEEPPNPIQMTKKRTGIKVVMIGPIPKKSCIDISSCDVTNVGTSSVVNGKGNAMLKPKASNM